MRFNYERVASYTLLLIAFFSFYLQVKGQTTKGVYRSRFTFKLLIRDDGSATISTALIQPTQAFPLSGGMLKRPSCKATFPYKLESKRVEWNIQIKAAETGGNCIETANYELKNLSELNQLLNTSNGSVKEKEGNFTLNIFNTHKSLSSRLLEQPVTYTYTITVPNIQNFSKSDGVKTGNTVTWTFESKNQVLEISGKILAGNNEEDPVAEDKDVCDREDDKAWHIPNEKRLDPSPRNASEQDILRAQEIVKANKEFIMAAAKEFGVDPKAIAGAIFAEHARNMNFLDSLSTPGARAGYDTSVGIGQIKISTAKKLDDGVGITKTPPTPAHPYPYAKGKLGITPPTANHNLINRLLVPKENIRFAAKYFKRIQETLPKTKDNPTRLIHIYNIGEYGKDGEPRNIGDVFGYDCFAADATAQFSFFESIGIK